MRVIICENDGAMDGLLQLPTATAFDAVSALLSASVYLLAALAGIARAPRDARTRVFLVIAIASAAPYCVTALIWRDGAQAALSRTVILVVATSLLVGSLALFHFAQVFPWRRPWIAKFGPWLRLAYAGVALLAVAATLVLPAFPTLDGAGGVGAVSPGFSELLAIAILLGVIPVLFVFGIVIPFAGLMSLYKSWLESRARRFEAARVTTFWMLVSQMGGGVLTILIIPLLRLIAPRGPWVTISAALLFGFSLLMPIAFAVGVFRLHVLDGPADAPRQ